MYAQWFKPQSYLRNRTAWVVGVRTIRLLAALVFLVPLERGAVPAGSRLPLLSGWLRGGVRLNTSSRRNVLHAAQHLYNPHVRAAPSAAAT
jgi:hypothetical protein